MSTLSNLVVQGVNSFTTPTNTVSAALLQVAATKLSVINTLTTLGTNSNSPVTYNSAGMLSPSQQTNSTNTITSAQDAYFQVESAISQTLNSLVSNTSSNSSNSDISSLFNLPGATDTNNPFAISLGSILVGNAGTPTSGVTAAQAAQYAVLSAQYAVSQTLNSLTTNTSSTFYTTA